MDSAQIRQCFLNFFAKKGHSIVPSSSLVPGNDPTLLFTNAGMVQFKNVFLGNEDRPYVAATSAQRCVRAGGKHNDLENVGYTARHHTFFEMLGNFSFGDYFKERAIAYAWEFLTEVLLIPKEKLWITVYKDDQESAHIWLNKVGVDPDQFSYCGEKDNFWSMGDTGPCGPCTEIFYDHGAEVPGGPPGSADEDGDRYVEIWNIVFMQYNRDIRGELTTLPKPCVDTGMGLERVAAVMQGVTNNYDITLFQNLLKALGAIIACDDINHTSMRVIADHIRSSVFLIADGVMPSNEGKGYVLRRIIRRAARHGYKLGQSKPFFYQLVEPLINEMGEAYPELKKQQEIIQQVLRREEEQFTTTLDKGLKIFEQAVSDADEGCLSGETIFQLYDTYGFPPDLTADIAREKGISMDYQGFDQAMARQRQQSKKANHFKTDYTEQLHISGETEFCGYEKLTCEAIITTCLFKQQPVAKLMSGQKGVLVLDRTPFYAESGGQVGDEGVIYGSDFRFIVEDTQKKGLVYLHYGLMLEGDACQNDKVTAEVSNKRQAVMLNHTATHLLHSALKRVLGEHIKQKGSLVSAERLRFDFSHLKALSDSEISDVEEMVNQQIRANIKTSLETLPLDEAKKKGAIALFGEKYSDQVRVLSIGEFSIEACGGTHVSRTGDIGLFKIIAEESVASGVRRIEAVAGATALKWVSQQSSLLSHLSGILKAEKDDLPNKLNQLLKNTKDQEKSLLQLKKQLARQRAKNLLDQALTINEVQVLSCELKNTDRDELRFLMDELKNSLSDYAIVLASVDSGRVQLISSVAKSCLKFFNATELINCVAKPLGGKGGGRPELAQGGADNTDQLNEVLANVASWVKNQTATQVK